MYAMLRRLPSPSVFISLLLHTIFSTAVVAVVSVACLQRVADEHPRRYLSRVLFKHYVASLDTEALRRSRIDGSTLEVYPLGDLPENSDLPFAQLIRDIHDDPDGVATTMFRDRYLAATIRGDEIIVLPQYGQLLSAQAKVLVGVVLGTIVAVLIFNYFSIRYLTSPFSVFKAVVKNVDDNNLSYRVPIERTYGEFRDLADSFNGMLQRLEHVNVARKHMLLAIPHEVRTPLARLKVRKDLIDNPELRDEISRDINALEELLNSILETERLQTNAGKVTRRSFEAVPFLNGIRDRFGGQVELDLRTAKHLFFADEFLLALMVKNLVANAIRYGRNNPVTIRVEEAPGREECLVLSVEDRGIGIPADQIPYVTEPFWRLDESRQRNSGGYGLGLYLCNTIAKSHNGKLAIKSVVGEGTTVVVTLPGALRSDHGDGTR